MNLSPSNLGANLSFSPPCLATRFFSAEGEGSEVWQLELEEEVITVPTATVAEAAAEAGARFVYPAFGMTLRDQQREYYYQALEKGFPGLAERYRRQYGPRYECPSPRAKALWAALEERCRALGLLCRMRDITAAYQRGYGERQLTFF